MENWKKFLKEEEHPQEEPSTDGGSWPSSPPKNLKITANSNLSGEEIMSAWNSLAAMSPPNDPDKILQEIGGEQQLIQNVKLLESNFSAASSNPPRSEMPVVEPNKGDIEDLKNRLSKGELDVKPPFAPDGASQPSAEDFPKDLAMADQEEQDDFLTKGLDDNNPTDDSAVTLSPKPIPVKSSFPTQQQVYLDKSMWNIMNFGPTPVGGTAFGKPNLIAINDGDQNYILDGHHRWSSAYVSGGENAQIKVQSLMGLDIPTAISALRSYGNARDNVQKT